MKEQNFQIGRLVRSRAGRDAGRYFVITGFPEENYAYISDGAVRKLNAPKKKKLKHLELCPQDVQAIRAKLEAGSKVFDSELKSCYRGPWLKYQTKIRSEADGKGRCNGT